MVFIGLCVFIVAVLIVMLGFEYLEDRPAKPSRSEKKDIKALEKENLRLTRIINRLDGMAQNEYDASNNLFAHAVRQEILTNRKEIA